MDFNTIGDAVGLDVGGVGELVGEVVGVEVGSVVPPSDASHINGNNIEQLVTLHSPDELPGSVSIITHSSFCVELFDPPQFVYVIGFPDA